MGTAAEPTRSRPEHRMSAPPSPGPLDRPDLAPLVDELARRFAMGDLPARISLQNLGSGGRRALADLLGLDRVPAATSTLAVGRIARAAAVESVGDLRVVIEQLRGPLGDRRAELGAARQSRDALWTWIGSEAASLPIGTADDRRRWVERVRAQGARGGVDAHRRHMASAFAVLRGLPADGESLASLAADVLGDPHGLDHGHRVSSLVLDLVALAEHEPPPDDAEGVRLLWESVGVAPDPLSSSVLVLGLGAATTAPEPLGALLLASAEAVEPVVLTLSQLRRWPVAPLPTGTTALVVENPSILSEANRMGWRGPPIVCSSGRPSVAVVTLLRQLSAAGAVLLQHADFDPAGLGITAWLRARAGTTPWRMGAADYREAVDGAVHARSRFERLPATPWDPALHEVMAARGVAVYEEQVRATLLEI
jgi:uncharacterized protein (TIGR02679 family)